MARTKRPLPVLYVCNDCGRIAVGTGALLAAETLPMPECRGDLHDWKLPDWEPISSEARRHVDRFRESKPKQPRTKQAQ